MAHGWGLRLIVRVGSSFVQLSCDGFIASTVLVSHFLKDETMRKVKRVGDGVECGVGLSLNHVRLG